MRRTRVALVLFVFLLAIPSVSGLATAVGWDSVVVIVAILLIGALVATIVIKRHRTEQSDDKDDGFWGSIPDWQYEGRFAEAGGLTRNEQSEVVEKIRTDAKEIERDRR